MIAPPSSPSATAAIVAVTVGIALFSLMDAAIKDASMAVGVYTALLLRNVLGLGMILPIWLAGARKLPARRVLGLHALRSCVNAGMALLFFIALTRLPMAEAMALSFIAPLVALYLAAMLLGETIRRRAIMASLLGLAGVAVIVADRFGTGQASREALIGVAAVLASAMLYAVNLVLQRKLALQAGPIEISLFQNAIITALLGIFAPWLSVAPSLPALGSAALGALLGTIALCLLAWGYARAEAQVLVPIEYSAFLWAALVGWVWFGEPLGTATLAGTVLIVAGCWIGTRNPVESHVEQIAV
jgi:S-adenosylmethionine uptake transporter